MRTDIFIEAGNGLVGLNIACGWYVPEKYRNLIVRIAGYSAYFVELSEDLQNDLIARTAHVAV